MSKIMAIHTDLPPDVQATLNDVADRIRDRLQLTIKNIIEIGHDLNAVKTELGHGRFTPWIETEFGMSDQTARNFMNVATRFPKSQSLLDLKITKEALYLLAAPSTDGEVVEVVMGKAEAGAKVGKAEVVEIKERIKAKKNKSRALRTDKTAHEVQFKALGEGRTFTALEGLHNFWRLCSEEQRKRFLSWTKAGAPEGPIP